MTAPPRKLIVFCAGTPWEGISGTDYHMANALSASADVLWVDPPASIFTSRRLRRDTSRLPWPKLQHVREGFARLTTYSLPGATRPLINRTTGPLMRAQIDWALKRLGRHPDVVVACTLEDVLSGWRPGVLRALYGTDDFVAGAELMGIDRSVLLAKEQRQLANADVVIAVSDSLAARWRQMGKRVRVIRNGVLAEAYQNLERIPSPEVDLPSPVAGVVGQLSARIDIAHLEAVVDNGCSLLLVGPRDPAWEPQRWAALLARDRVRWVDRQPFAAMAGFLKVMDVGLTPYTDTSFNRASFPLKTMEYLAAGLPTVSTDLPAVRWLATDLIAVASTPAEFAAATRRLAAERHNPHLQTRRRELAATHAWSRRAQEFADAIEVPTPTTDADPASLRAAAG